MILFAGMGLVLLGGWLRTEQPSVAAWLTLVGLGGQFMAGVVLLWKFASQLNKPKE